MTIGTDSKLSDYLSDGGRIKVGAKGIGRFALDRLGEKCTMITKSINDRFYKWKVNWSDFDVKDRTISEVNATLSDLNSYSFSQRVIELSEDRIQYLNETDDSNTLKNLDDFIQTFSLRKTGTHLNIKETYEDDEWEDFDFKSLYENLRSLIPPFNSNSFRLMFIVDSQPGDFGEVSSVVTDDYDYRLDADVKSNGRVKISINRNEFNINKLEDLGFFDSNLAVSEAYKKDNFENPYVYNSKIENIVPGASDNEQLLENLKDIGPFTFSFYFLKRGYGGGEKGTNKYPYNKFIARDRIKWLNEFGGIKIYRDKFRVRPYGEVDSSAFDWLGLGKRAVGSPTVTRKGYKVRPNQVVGIINISRVGNSKINDTSSREGLQENEIFSVFKRVVEELIHVFELDRNKIMINLKRLFDEKDEREKTKKDADEIEDKESKKNRADQDEDKKKLIDAISIYKEEAEELRHDQRIMRALASTGLIITSFTHEFAQLKRKMSSRARNLKNSLTPLLDDHRLSDLPEEENPIVLIEDIRSQDKRLKSWLEFTISAVKKDKRSRKKIDLVTYVNQFERTWNSLLAEREVNFSLSKDNNFTSVYFNGFEIDLDSILNNLISNSIDVFRSKRYTGDRNIEISFSLSSNISIIYEDSGPGLSKDIIDPEQIFEPFFTTKTKKSGEINGTGLGMYIVKSIVDDYKGKIIFHKIRSGFKIEINLPYKN